MFKGIVAARQAAAQTSTESVQEFTVEQALDALVGLEELHEAEVKEAVRAETLKNARALRTALEQFGTDATATRALLAFADADGQLSAAFGVKHEGALESVDDTQILVDAATIAGGLESYILGEEQIDVSVEGWNETVARHKKALTILAASAAAVAKLFGRGPGIILSAAAVGAGLWVVNKLINKGRTDGSAADAIKMITRTELCMKIISAASGAAFSDDPEKAVAAVKGLVGKVEGDAKSIGIEIVWDDKSSRYSLKTIKGEDWKGVDPKMVPFAESGWNEERLKSVSESMKKLCLEVGAVCSAADKKLFDRIDSNGNVDVDKQLMFVFDLVDCASTEARYTLNQLTRTVKSASKFFTTEKPEEGKPSEGEKPAE